MDDDYLEDQLAAVPKGAHTDKPSKRANGVSKYHVPCNMPDCNIMFESIEQMHEHFERKHDNNPVNHPKHYVSHPSGIECIEVTRHYNFNVGNAMKYLWRQGLKDSEPQVQDIRKAIWYLEDEIKRLEQDAT